MNIKQLLKKIYKSLDSALDALIDNTTPRTHRYCADCTYHKEVTNFGHCCKHGLHDIVTGEKVHPRISCYTARGTESYCGKSGRWFILSTKKALSRIVSANPTDIQGE